MDNMTENENVLTEKIICQEWVVMFDGQIKKSENEIDAFEHHLEVNSQKNE